MASAPDYVFTRDYLDNNRINLQHHIWVSIFGYHTHPSIPTDDAKLKIADVGTGTGTWLTDLSSRLPSTVELDGLDISFHATPPVEWLPPNITLRHWNIKDEVPEELVGYYDIVHIRNFLFVLLDSETPQVLNNLVRLIKPGGYLQWGEPDMLSWRIDTTQAGNSISALKQLMQLSQPQDQRLSPTWVPQLPKLFGEAGLVVVETDVKEAAPAMALQMHECALMIHELVARKSDNARVAQQLQELMPKVAEETRAGACWAFTRWTVVGRKPERS
ncbi:unnamed protein product [Clonostachys rhizophaga]|uniref:Methyltransferase domain-containing protein n=1 Tax=Clonostachys rhizophaga TaxID=160324 RepID=A0A9N9VNW4_9HYPO|nr:unnamed protein product [Clonostachys rhizophaga]